MDLEWEDGDPRLKVRSHGASLAGRGPPVSNRHPPRPVSIRPTPRSFAFIGVSSDTTRVPGVLPTLGIRRSRVQGQGTVEHVIVRKHEATVGMLIASLLPISRNCRVGVAMLPLRHCTPTHCRVPPEVAERVVASIEHARSTAKGYSVVWGAAAFFARTSGYDRSGGGAVFAAALASQGQTALDDFIFWARAKMD